MKQISPIFQLFMILKKHLYSKPLQMKAAFNTGNAYWNMENGIYISKDQTDFLLPSVFQVKGWKTIWQISARPLSWHKVEGLAQAFGPSFILTEIWPGIKDDFYDSLGNHFQHQPNQDFYIIYSEKGKRLSSRELLVAFVGLLQKTDIFELILNSFPYPVLLGSGKMLCNTALLTSHR